MISTPLSPTCPSTLSPRFATATREDVRLAVQEGVEKTQRHMDAQLQRLLEAYRSLEGEIHRQKASTSETLSSPSRSRESISGMSAVGKQVSIGGRKAEGILIRAGMAGSLHPLEITRPSPRLLGSTGRSPSTLNEQDDGVQGTAQAGRKAEPHLPFSARSAPIASSRQVSELTNGEQQAERRSSARPTYASRRTSLRPASVLGIDDGVEPTLSEREAEKQKERVAKLGLTQALGMGKSISRRRSFEEVTNKVNDNYHMQNSCLQHLVDSNRFELLSGLVITANVLVMGFQANERIRNPNPSCVLTWHLVNLAFNVFFLCELVLRMAAFGRRFLKGKDKYWNLFDMVIVGSGVIEELVQWVIVLQGNCNSNGEFGAGIDALRIIRVLRLMRLARVIRVMHLFSELRIMVRSVLVCLAPLCWACILLLLIQWCFGIFFCTLAADHISNGLAGKSPQQQAEWLQDPTVTSLFDYWGSLWRALYTLFLSVTNGLDWHQAADSMSDIGIHPLFAYILYIALTSFAVLNVVTGVFVENAMKIALRDRDLQVQVQLNQRKKIMERLLSVFHEADKNRDGTISWEDFEAHIGDPKVQAFFSHLELGGADAGRLFRLLDRNGNGKVDAEEFVTGCLILRGGAKTMDVAAVMLEQRIFMEYFAEQLDCMRDTIQGGPRDELSPVNHHISTASSVAAAAVPLDRRADIMV